MESSQTSLDFVKTCDPFPMDTGRVAFLNDDYAYLYKVQRLKIEFNHINLQSFLMERLSFISLSI